MITNKSFTKTWIDSLRKLKRKIDPGLCEKMIRALGLLEQLVIKKLDFVFKGGTALILLIDEPQRFSIDIDINLNTSEVELEDIFSQIISSGVFIKYEENLRKRSSIPKAHYKFYYKSVIFDREDYILLDVLFHKHTYPEVIYTPIKTVWLDTDENYTFVKTPSIDAILGDKLTAFAPSTIGIQYGCAKEMEIIKQLFDIGRLFDHAKNITTIAKSFNSIAKDEISFRKKDLTSKLVLNDIIQTCLLIAKLDYKVPKDQEKSDELIKGINRFKNYLISNSFNMIEAKVASSKAAYIATKILYENTSNFEHFNRKAHLLPNLFKSEFTHLNKLRKQVPEAYFYWIKIFEIRKTL